MSAVAAADVFVDFLRKSRLLSDEEIDNALWEHGLREETSSIKVAKGLVRGGVLTKFQAERILNGRWRGLVLGNYKLVEVLGAGGMGWVYAAQELDSDWQVAIKVLGRDRRRDSAMRARMQLEAQAGLRLKHPNILRTLSINKTEDRDGEFLYVVMELIRGITPLELLAVRGDVPVPMATDICMQAAIGLQYAHEQGLVHRDVKPENLLVRSNGAIKILDFGLAMVDENDEEFSMAMIFGQDRVGTADYVAPEQTVNSYKVDHRVDIYSLGCTLYTLLARQVPFPYKEVPKKLKGHRKKKPRPIEELNTQVPTSLIQIVDKMMAKSRRKRYQTAEEVAEILKPYAHRESVDYDFERVMKARVKQAERRLKHKTQQLLSRETVTSSSGESGNKPQATIETVVRKDTLMDDEPKSEPEAGDT